jgi:hypothetical protein
MDPLRPFAGLIRTLWKSNTPSTSRSDASTASSSGATEQGQNDASIALEEATLRTQIRTRLARVGLGDPRRAREVFVETVLTAELGETLVRDPAFTDMVKRVAEHIGADEQLGNRLHALLQTLAAEPPHSP